MAISVILTETFTGKISWDEWEDHFFKMVTMNRWSRAEKLNMQKV